MPQNMARRIRVIPFSVATGRSSTVHLDRKGGTMLELSVADHPEQPHESSVSAIATRPDACCDRRRRTLAGGRYRVKSTQLQERCSLGSSRALGATALIVSMLQRDALAARTAG
jgi:hypothetical protein